MSARCIEPVYSRPLCVCSSWRARHARHGPLRRTGRFEEAALAWQEAAQAFAAEGERTQQVSALVRKAEAQQSLGRYAESLQTLSEARSAAGDQAAAAELAAIEGSTGNAYHVRFPQR